MHRRSGLVVAATWLVLAACSGGDSSTSTSAHLDVGERGPSASGGTPTTSAPPATVPTATTVPTASLAEAPPAVTGPTVTSSAGFDLRVGGLGDLDFGASTAAVIDAISGAFGPPLADDAAHFPVTVGISFENESTSQAFTSPYGRTVCWPGLCAQFGGDDLATLSFVGWVVSADPRAASVRLATDDGLTLGSRWSDFIDVMSVQPGGCPTTGSGTTTGGIDLALQGSENSAGRFSTVSDSGEYVELLPDPTQVTVVGMQAGSLVVSLDEGC